MKKGDLFPLHRSYHFKGRAQYRAQYTGERRPPRKGEWYLSGGPVEAYRAPNDLPYPFHIAKIVSVSATRSGGSNPTRPELVAGGFLRPRRARICMACWKKRQHPKAMQQGYALCLACFKEALARKTKANPHSRRATMARRKRRRRNPELLLVGNPLRIPGARMYSRRRRRRRNYPLTVKYRGRRRSWRSLIRMARGVGRASAIFSRGQKYHGRRRIFTGLEMTKTRRRGLAGRRRHLARSAKRAAKRWHRRHHRAARRPWMKGLRKAWAMRRRRAANSRRRRR